MSEEEVKKQNTSAEAPEQKKAPEQEAADKEARPSQPSAADLLNEEVAEVKIRRVKGAKLVPVGRCYVLATYNNTKVSFTDDKGNAISWSSAGKCNFRGSRKSTAYAAQVVTNDAGRKALERGMKEVSVFLKGPGMGRDSAVRALASLGFRVKEITDTTPIPHNGCRPPKRRRV